MSGSALAHHLDDEVKIPVAARWHAKFLLHFTAYIE